MSSLVVTLGATASLVVTLGTTASLVVTLGGVAFVYAPFFPFETAMAFLAAFWARISSAWVAAAASAAAAASYSY